MPACSVRVLVLVRASLYLNLLSLYVAELFVVLLGDAEMANSSFLPNSSHKLYILRVLQVVNSGGLFPAMATDSRLSFCSKSSVPLTTKEAYK